MHSPFSEALLFRHDAGSGLFGSDIEPLSDLQESVTPRARSLRTFTCVNQDVAVPSAGMAVAGRITSAGAGDTGVTSWGQPLLPTEIHSVWSVSPLPGSAYILQYSSYRLAWPQLTDRISLELHGESAQICYRALDQTY
jgi:hypothetical protein